jgi:hypothetical protein
LEGEGEEETLGRGPLETLLLCKDSLFWSAVEPLALLAPPPMVREGGWVGWEEGGGKGKYKNQTGGRMGEESCAAECAQKIEFQKENLFR